MAKEINTRSHAGAAMQQGQVSTASSSSSREACSPTTCCGLQHLQGERGKQLRRCHDLYKHPITLRWADRVISSRGSLNLTPHLAFSCRLQPAVRNFINGKFVESKAKTWFDVRNPATQELICRVPQSTPEEVSVNLMGHCSLRSVVYTSQSPKLIVSRFHYPDARRHCRGPGGVQDVA